MKPALVKSARLVLVVVAAVADSAVETVAIAVAVVNIPAKLLI